MVRTGGAAAGALALAAGCLCAILAFSWRVPSRTGQAMLLSAPQPDLWSLSLQEAGKAEAANARKLNLQDRFTGIKEKCPIGTPGCVRRIHDTTGVPTVVSSNKRENLLWNFLWDRSSNRNAAMDRLVTRVPAGRIAMQQKRLAQTGLYPAAAGGPAPPSAGSNRLGDNVLSVPGWFGDETEDVHLSTTPYGTHIPGAYYKRRAGTMQLRKLDAAFLANAAPRAAAVAEGAQGQHSQGTRGRAAAARAPAKATLLAHAGAAAHGARAAAAGRRTRTPRARGARHSLSSAESGADLDSFWAQQDAAVRADWHRSQSQHVRDGQR
jgi:hypothetical protein